MSKVQEFKAGTKLYSVVSTIDMHQNTMFFLQPGNAIIWSLISNPLTHPKKEVNILDQLLGYVKGQKVDIFFNGSVKLMEASFGVDTKVLFQFVEEETFLDLRVIQANSVALFNHTVISPLFEEKFVVVGSDGKISTSSSFDNLINVLAKVGNQRISKPVIRFANFASVNREALFDVNWEIVWQVFIILMNQGNTIDEMSNMINGSIGSYINLQSRQQYVPPSYGEFQFSPPPKLPPKIEFENCHPEMRGFENQGSSCFMDSTLLAMFMFKTSPFHTNLIVKDFQRPKYGSFGEGTLCFQIPRLVNEVPITQKQINSLIEYDFKKRTEIQELLRLDYKLLTQGKRHMCTTLRIELGRNCRGGGDDFSEQPADPAEMYRRLCNVLEYNPISYNQTTEVAKANETGLPNLMETRMIKFEKFHSPTLPALNVNDPLLEKVSWPSSWVEQWSALEIPLADPTMKEFVYKKLSIDMVNADCIAVEINRAKFDPVQTWMPVAGVNNKRLQVNMVMFIGGLNEVYHLMGVVYPPFFGHYSALLRCDGGWYHYDDMPGRNSFISQHPLNLEDAREIIETKGVLLFYYKLPEISLTPTSERRIQQISKGMSGLQIPKF